MPLFGPTPPSALSSSAVIKRKPLNGPKPDDGATAGLSMNTLAANPPESFVETPAAVIAQTPSELVKIRRLPKVPTVSKPMPEGPPGPLRAAPGINKGGATPPPGGDTKMV